MSVDITVPALRLVVEFDGSYWHRGNDDTDLQKTLRLEAVGWRVVRLRENPLERIHDDSILVERNAKAFGLTVALLDGLAERGLVDPRIADEYRRGGVIRADPSRATELLDLLLADRSLAVTDPNLAAEWNPERNGFPATAVQRWDKRPFWWRCALGHEWDAAPMSRVTKGGTGCPYCVNKRVGYGNDLASRFPHLASEWAVERNAPLSPCDVVPGSHKRVWWRCESGHEWESAVEYRVKGSGCPYCSKEK